jgi:CheY-like chemotaxis protein
VVPQWRPDLILLDVMMPEMDGPTTLRALREQGHQGPVVFITARSQASEQQALIAAGAQGVISKPFDPMKLAATVLQYLPG